MDKREQEVACMAALLEQTGRLALTRGFIQHGNVSVYAHCMRVARTSCLMADGLRISVDRDAMIRGALLHDYFLYDWHNPQNGHPLHGFSHPGTAADNAREDYGLTLLEEDIILHHMFPLTLFSPPRSREAVIVCLADKACAAAETAVGMKLFALSLAQSAKKLAHTR